MKEEFLHYVWQFQKFSPKSLQTTSQSPINIIKVGTANHNAGPDFLMAQLEIEGQLWAGNVEIHIKSSDWYAHHHEIDSAYENVILHVVWQHDAEIYRKDETVIPTLVLKDLVPETLLTNYKQLIGQKSVFIPCEKQFQDIPDDTLQHWLSRLFIERLEEKSAIIKKELEASQNDWEAVFFAMLCKNFGLKVNAESFLSIAKSVPYNIIRKQRQNVSALEALLFGQAGFLLEAKEDVYYQTLQEQYAYSKTKYHLTNDAVINPKFFRLRPPNFPTIRLSQLAMLWSTKPQLFSEIIKAQTKAEFEVIFNVKANDYWDSHYNFQVPSVKRKKILTSNFIDLILVNTIIPLKFSYACFQGEDVIEQLIDLTRSIASEKNTLIAGFQKLKKVENTAWCSQSLLQLKNQYCSKVRCLQCEIGNYILKR